MRCVPTARHGSSHGGPRRGLHYRHTLAGEDLLERGGELGVTVPYEEAEGAGPVAGLHEQIAGLLRGPGAIWVGGHAEDMHVPGRYLHDEQDVQALEEDRVHGEEAAGQQSLRLSAARIARSVQSGFGRAI